MLPSTRAHQRKNLQAKRNQATVAMGFVSGMLSGMHRHGHDPTPLLAATGISLADAASRIPVDR